MTKSIARKEPQDLILSAANLPTERGLDEAEANGLMVFGAGLLGAGIAKRGLYGLLMAGVGAGLVYRWLEVNELLGPLATRRLLNTANDEIAEVTAAVRIAKPAEELFDLWSDLERMPLFMRHVDFVDKVGLNTFAWQARVPKTGQRIQWFSEIIDAPRPDRIVWQTLAGSDFHHQGVIIFEQVGPLQTEVIVNWAYRVPAGGAGGAFARLLGGFAHDFLRDHLADFKAFAERGELPPVSPEDEKVVGPKSIETEV